MAGSEFGAVLDMVTDRSVSTQSRSIGKGVVVVPSLGCRVEAWGG